MTTSRLDSRAWLVWMLGVMTPVLLSRNPLLLVEVLVIVLSVRAVWLPRATEQGMAWFIRIAGVMVAISVVFNLLTVHSGNVTLIQLPGSWPIVGGDLTLNALVYGVISGLALFTLVLTGITVSTLISWVDLFHALPNRLAPIAITGSVAWTFLPQTAVAWQQICEAQMMRGHRLRRVQDFVPLVVPLLAGGLERSLVMAEALEARGFGASSVPASQRASGVREVVNAIVVVIGIVAIAMAAYSLAVGMLGVAAVAFALGSILLIASYRVHHDASSIRTRYRVPVWRAADSLVVVTAAASAVATIAWNVARPETLLYSVYPGIGFPPVDLVLMLIVSLLLTPAFVIAAPGGTP